jgi:hypothetical protein
MKANDRHIYDKNDPPSQFSLFEGDLMNRAFNSIGIGSRGVSDIFLRAVVIIAITWGGMALLSIEDVMNLPPEPRAAQNFFYDFAAYAQFFVGIPLYLVAERVIGESIMGAARDFEDSGVVSTEDIPQLHETEKTVERLRKKLWPEIICIGISFFFAFMAFAPELVRPPSEMMTWHVRELAQPQPFLFWTMTHTYTAAGLYATMIALPLQTYIWVRWVAKIWFWYWYLRRVSRFKLNLIASHPDKTGGIGFLSEVQAKFALIILAGGISGVVATVGYKIAVEQAPINLPPVYGLVLGFAIGAPILFLAPLLLFTKQLGRTKKRALAQFREKAMVNARRVEEKWLHTDYNDETEAGLRTELNQLNLLSGFFDRIHGMRVVPFDLRSAGQLIGSALGPIIPLIPYFFDLPEGPWKEVLEAIRDLFPGK